MNESAYPATVEALQKFGRFTDTDAEDFTWQSVLFHGFPAYMSKCDTLDDELIAAKTMAEQIFAFLPEKATRDEQWPYAYGAYAPGDGQIWDAKRDFSTRMPDLSGVSAQAPKEKNCLVVFRNDRDGDIEDWYIDLSFLPTLPPEFIPESVEKASVLVTVDTKWEFEFNYTNGSKGYGATVVATAYDMHGNLLKELGTAEASPPIFNDTDENVYANIGSHILAVIAAYIDSYLTEK